MLNNYFWCLATWFGSNIGVIAFTGHVRNVISLVDKTAQEIGVYLLRFGRGKPG